MAGSSQPQHFFAAECIFTDFEAMITDTVSTRTSAGLMAISIWGFATSRFFGARFFRQIFMAPGATEVGLFLKMLENAP